MATPGISNVLTNASGGSVVHGMIVRGNGNGTFTLAQVDTTPHVAGVLGVNGSGTIANGGPANIFTAGAPVDVLLESGLTPTAGSTVYISASTAGLGTTTAPTTVAAIGTIESAAQYARTRLVQVALAVGAGGGAAAIALSGYVTASISGASSCAFSGARVGDHVLFVIDPTGIDPDPPSHFEATISVANQIQQLSGFPGATFPVPVLVGRGLL